MCDLPVVDTMLEELMHVAEEAKQHAYAPYSDFKVGAAVITNEGKVYAGANIENATYGAAICAERVAIYKALYDGAKSINVVAISSDKYDTTPCGICRQVMSEFTGEDGMIICTEDEEGKLIRYTLDELLPHAFKL